MPLHRLPPPFNATGGDGGNIVAAGTQTANSTGTVMFSNSNGITFGMSNSSIITASHNGITSQTNQTLGMYGTSNTTQGTSGTVDARSLTFKGDGIVSVGISNGSVVISATGGGGGNINLSAGSTSNNLTNFVLSNSNGVSFGLDGSTVTASHNGLTSQSNQALSAANGSFTFQTATFANSNGVSFSTGTQGIYATVKTDYLTTMLTHNSVHHSGTIFPGTDQYVGSAFMEYGTTSVPSTPGAGKVRHVAIAENGKVRDAVVTPDGSTFVREQDQYITVYNNSGSTITKGKWVYIHSVTAGIPEILLADSQLGVWKPAIGVVLEDITNGSNGRVQIRGVASNLDTSGFSVGDLLYLSTNGDASASVTVATHPNLTQYLGYVLTSDATTGRVLLFPIKDEVLGLQSKCVEADFFLGNSGKSRIRLYMSGSKAALIQWTGTSNDRTYHLPAGTAANATLMTNFNVSAGAASNNLTALTFSNSNGITFGLNASTITASHNGITSQTNQTLGLYASSNTTAQSSSSTMDARSLTFRGMGVASVGMSAGEVVISVPSGGGAGDGVNILAAGTQTANTTGTVLFNDSNGITFGMSNSSVITASHNGLTSQSNQALSGSNGSFAFQTATFGNLNGMSFYTSNGSMVGSYTVPSTAGLLSNIKVSAGTTSNNLSALTFSDSNGVSFGLNGSVVTATVKTDYLTSQSNQAVSAANGSYAFQTLSFSNANGVSFGTSAGSAITASHNGLTSQSNQAFSAQGGSSAFQTLSFNNANGATFSNNGGAVEISYTRPVVSNAIASVGSATNSGTNTSRFAADDHVHAGVFSIGVSTGGNTSGDTRVDVGRFVFQGGNNITLSQVTAANALNTIVISGGAGGAGNTGSISAGTTRGTLGEVVFSNSNGVTFGMNGQTMTASHNGLTSQSNQAFSAAGGSSAFQTLGFSDNAYASWTNTNGSVALTELRGSFFATNNTTQSSSGTINLDSVIFRGEGIASVGVSNGSVVVSVPSGGGAGDGYNIVQIGTTGTTGTSWSSATATVQLNGSNGITVSQNNSNQIVISGDGVTLSNYSRFFGELSLAGTVAANSVVSVIPFEIPNYISVSQFMFGGSVSVASAVNTSSAYQDISQSVVIYTRDGTSLGSVASGSVTATYTWTSNATASIGGRRLYKIPLGGVLLTPGQYWAAVHMSTANTATGGAATTALGASHSLFLAGSVNTNWFGWHPIGSATSDFGQGVAFGLGAISTGATVSTLAFSSITETGTRPVNANLVFVLRNYNYP